jgi:hypothetical protein
MACNNHNHLALHKTLHHFTLTLHYNALPYINTPFHFNTSQYITLALHLQFHYIVIHDIPSKLSFINITFQIE